MADLSPIEKETIIEVISIALGASAGALANLLKQKVTVTTPEVRVVEKAEVGKDLSPRCLLVKTRYLSGLRGSQCLLIKEEDAAVIASLIMKTYQQDELGQQPEMQLSAIAEAMNQMMGLSAITMAELFHRPISVDSPEVIPCDLSQREALFNKMELEEETAVEISFRVEIADILDSTIFLVASLAWAKELVAFMLSGQPESPETFTSSPPVEGEVEPPAEGEREGNPAGTGPEKSGERPQPEEQEGAVPEQPVNRGPEPPLGQEEQESPAGREEEREAPEGGPDFDGKLILPVISEEELAAAGGIKVSGTVAGGPAGQEEVQEEIQEEQVVIRPVHQEEHFQIEQLELVKDIPVTVTAVFARKKVPLGTLLTMKRGGLLELERHVGEPVEIMVKDKVVARGEVVMVNEYFGVRITSLEEQSHRPF